MKRIFCITLCTTALVLSATAQTTITLDSTVQNQEHCTTVTVYYTANSNNNAYIAAYINDIWLAPIGFASVCMPTSLENYHGSIAVPIPPNAFGSHHCTLMLINENDSASIMDDVDLMSCPNTDLQQVHQQQQYSITVNNHSITIATTNVIQTLVTIYNLHGQEILQTIIFTTTTLPITVQHGMYSVILQQPGNIAWSYKFVIH